MKTSSVVGVIVGRFQVPNLTTGHKAIIDKAIHNHGRVIIVLGISKASPSNINPLDFITRSVMIKELYPYVMILPLEDQDSDKVWSENLDALLRSVYHTENFKLYSGRLGFALQYTGINQVQSVDPVDTESGTEVREQIKNQLGQQHHFRCGAIYATLNRYPHVFPTVDVAILKGGNQIIVGRKKGEPLWRFIGGFINPGESANMAARREVREEVGCELKNIEFCASIPIDDWRYRRTSDSILTTFYVADYGSGPICPSDDISELKYMPYSELKENRFMKVHHPLLTALREHLQLDPIDKEADFWTDSLPQL